MKVTCVLLLGAVCYVYGAQFGPGPDDNARTITGAIQGIKNFFKGEVTTLKPYKPYPMHKPYVPYKPYYHKKPALTKPLKVPIPIPIPLPGKTGPIKLLVQVANIQDDGGSKNGKDDFVGNVIRKPKSLVDTASDLAGRISRSANGMDGDHQDSANDDDSNHDHANNDGSNHGHKGTNGSPGSSLMNAGINNLLAGINKNTDNDRDSRSQFDRIGNAVVNSPEITDISPTSAGINPVQPFLTSLLGASPDILGVKADLLGVRPPNRQLPTVGNAIVNSPASSGTRPSIPSISLGGGTGLGSALGSVLFPPPASSGISSALPSFKPVSSQISGVGNAFVDSSALPPIDTKVPSFSSGPPIEVMGNIDLPTF